MVVKYKEEPKVPVDEYYKNEDNAGKVAVFNMDDSTLIAEGDGDSDWVELELMYEELREQGHYDLIIVPQPKTQMQSFNWRMMA